MRLACLAAVAVLALAAGAASAQEKVENPEFVSWSKFKKGTTTTLKMTSTTAGVVTESTITTTLVEVGADKIVVEAAGVTAFNGMEFKAPPTSREVKKTIELPKGVKSDGPQGQKPKGAYEDGNETLKVGGMEIKTKWYKIKTEINGSTTDSKVWMSDDVPGNTVKMEGTTIGKVVTTIKMELIEFKKP